MTLHFNRVLPKYSCLISCRDKNPNNILVGGKKLQLEASCVKFLCLSICQFLRALCSTCNSIRTGKNLCKSMRLHYTQLNRASEGIQIFNEPLTHWFAFCLRVLKSYTLLHTSKIYCLTFNMRRLPNIPNSVPNVSRRASVADKYFHLLIIELLSE